MTLSTTTNKAAALSLYRSILRAHAKHLPPEMRSLGDSYVKSEFRLHKSITDEKGQLTQFRNAWNMYLDQIYMTARAKESLNSGVLDGNNSSSAAASSSLGDDTFGFGRDLPRDVDLSEEQKGQLEKLREEAKKAGSGK